MKISNKNKKKKKKQKRKTVNFDYTAAIKPFADAVFIA